MQTLLWKLKRLEVVSYDTNQTSLGRVLRTRWWTAPRKEGIGVKFHVLVKRQNLRFCNLTLILFTMSYIKI